MSEFIISALITAITSLLGFWTAWTHQNPRRQQKRHERAVATHHNNRVRVERMEHECLDAEFLQTITDEGFINHHRDCRGCEQLAEAKRQRERAERRKRLGRRGVRADEADDLFRSLAMTSFIGRHVFAEHCPECRSEVPA